MKWFWDLTPVMRCIIAALAIAGLLLFNWKEWGAYKVKQLSLVVVNLIILAICLWYCG